MNIQSTSYGLSHPKLKELVVADFNNVADESFHLTGYDACFYCAGVSSLGKNKEQFSRVIYQNKGCCIHLSTNEKPL